MCSSEFFLKMMSSFLVCLVEYQRLTYVLTLQSRTEKACASDQGRVGEVVQCKKRNAYRSVVHLSTPTVAAFVLSPIWDGFGTL